MMARVDRLGAPERADDSPAALAKHADLTRAAGGNAPLQLLGLTDPIAWEEDRLAGASPHRALIRQMQSDLQAAGLPLAVDASVHLRVVGDADPEHAERCARALAGPGVGLVENPPDLEITLRVDPSKIELSTRALDEAIRREQTELWDTKIYTDEGSFEDLARHCAYQALDAINFLRVQLARAVDEATDGITIASCSSVGNIERYAGWTLSLLDRIEPGSPLEKSIAQELGRDAPFDRDAKRALKQLIGWRIKAILDSDPIFRARVRALEGYLKEEAEAALDANVLMMVPSGNSYFGAAGMGDPELSRPIGVGDNAIVVVGALRLDPERGMVPLDAESIAPVQIVGLGGPLPIGDPPLKGTSYAPPFIAAVAALAASAGVGISAADLRGLLIDPRFQTEIPGRKNAGGLPDVVALCRAARELVR